MLKKPHGLKPILHYPIHNAGISLDTASYDPYTK